MRKQYHFRSSEGGTGLDAWDVDGLIDRARSLPVEHIELSAIDEIDTDYWFFHGELPTVRRVADHARLILDADLTFPIILGPDGRVMDGMHRIARALLQGLATVEAVRLPDLPPPDFHDCSPEELPY